MEEKILSGEELLLQYIKDILSEPGKAKLEDLPPLEDVPEDEEQAVQQVLAFEEKNSSV